MGYDVYRCSKPDCPWGASWPCQGRGACEGAPVLATVPLEAVAAIGQHALWHEREDVRAGKVHMVFDKSTGEFLEKGLED